MVQEHYTDKWREQYPWITTVPYNPPVTFNPPTQEEIDEFRRLLLRAREYDKKYSEPECELAEKKKILKDLAEKLGVEIDFL